MTTDDGGAAGFRLPRASRITRSAEIRALFQRGKRRRTRHFDAFVSASPVAFSRLGVVVGKHRHEIVERNQVRRRLRELGRTILLPALRNQNAALDVLLRARPETYAAPFEELRAEMASLTEELCSLVR